MASHRKLVARSITLVALAISIVRPAAAQNPPAGGGQVIVPTQTTPAQQAAAAAGRPLTNAQIAAAIVKSGLSEQEIKERLKAAGYDSTFADPFFRQKGQQGENANAAFVLALTQLGILSPAAGDTLIGKKTQTPGDSTRKPAVRDTGLRVFGKDIFTEQGSAFDPVTTGPVDPSYKIGVGDQLQAIVTGQTELAFPLEVRRDGTVIIPSVGQIDVAGLTLEGAKTLLRVRMARSYNGLATGQAILDLTISRVRSNVVTVLGEVERPGQIQVNALSTVFHALARAGGPTSRGTFRNVQLWRAAKLFKTIDLYEYLLKGDASRDERTEQGDIIVVPLNTRAVAITGAVRRPAIFELKPAETMADLLSFSGGLLASASVERIQIDRVLPIPQRRPGFERVKTDVFLRGRVDSLRSVPVLENDVVTVFSIGDTRRNVITIGGAVFHPGEFEFTPAMTLDTLIARAQGAQPWALTDRIKVRRPLLPTGRELNFSLDMRDPAQRRFPLGEFDEILVLDGRLAFPPRTLRVDGAVQAPFTGPFVERTRLRDAIDLAGGFTDDADIVFLARRRMNPEYSDTTSIIFQYNLTAQHQLDSAASAIVLEPDDRVSVRAAPGFRPQVFAHLDGLFAHPGAYAISERADKISDVVRRAGGTLPGAYDASFVLRRGGNTVAVDFTRAMRGDKNHNVELREGDTLRIGPDLRTVFVGGAVSSPSYIVYRPGLSLGDYIAMAGGPTEKGNVSRSFVNYPSGFSRQAHKSMGMFHSDPEIISGAVITVPERVVSKGNLGEALVRTVQISTTLASLFIAYAAVKK